MANRHLFFKYLTVAIVLAASSAIVVLFAGPDILRNYISAGIGNCTSDPILCKVPDEVIDVPAIDGNFRQGLSSHTMPLISVAAPTGFNVVEELVKKYYYKKNRGFDKGENVYLIYQKPGFFVGLYPSLKKKGVSDNYEFMKRVMHANLRGIKNFTDAFFVVMKGILTPDLGDQNRVRMAQFSMGSGRGFINYNMSGKEHFFDCTLISPEEDFFKVYIKDPRCRLDLEKVFTILSTLKKTPQA